MTMGNRPIRLSPDKLVAILNALTRLLDAISRIHWHV
jgi:hypothetical protein